MKKEHLLIICFSPEEKVNGIVPVVEAIATQYPELRVSVLSRIVERDLFEGLAPNVHFMSADLQREYHGVKGLNALYRRLVAKQFTAVADFQNILRSEYLRMRFNLGHYRVKHIGRHQSQTFENYANVLARLGYPIKIQSLITH